MKKATTPRTAAETLKRNLPKGNESVSYCCEAANQIKAEDLPQESPFARKH